MGSSCTECRSWKHLEGNPWKSCSEAESAPRSSLRAVTPWAAPLPSLGAPSCSLLPQLLVSPTTEWGLRVTWLKSIILYFYPWGWESGYSTGIMEWALWVDRSRAWVTAPDSPGTWRTSFPGILAIPLPLSVPSHSASLTFCCLKLPALLCVPTRVLPCECTPSTAWTWEWVLDPTLLLAPDASLLALLSLVLLLEFFLAFLTVFRLLLVPFFSQVVSSTSLIVTCSVSLFFLLSFPQQGKIPILNSRIS